MKTAKDLELSLLIKESEIHKLKLSIIHLYDKIHELEEQRDKYADLIFKAIGKTLELIDEGNEWHWDNGALEEYAEDILKVLKGEDNEKDSNKRTSEI